MSTEKESELTMVTDEMQSSITHMAQLRNTLVAFTREVLVKDQDYGVVSGVSKPTLLKPGAEKLMNLFSLTVEFECTDKILSLEEQFIAYTYKAVVRNKQGRKITECEGSANSFESKYRYIWSERPKPNQAEQDLRKQAGTGKFKKKDGSWVWVERVENPEVIGNQNTLQKMAQKRAFVGAILLATNASEFFTQDVEDMGFIDIEGTVVGDTDKKQAKQPEPTPQPPAAAPQPVTQQKQPVPAEHRKADGTPIPADILHAIETATTVAALYLVHKNNASLQQEENFIKLLSAKKAKIKKGLQQ